ncbi:MAG: amino acid adenylation domain-containing protein, partial [Acidobacteriota bacterium]
MTGPLDVGALEESLNEIVRRHDALRTSFSVCEGRPVQVISQARQVALPETDLRDLPVEAREREASRLAGLEAGRLFDLAQGPLFRAKLLRLTEEEHVLIVTMHHIVSDGWSVAVFMRELAMLYDAFRLGKPSPLPELPIQYADYALWQQNWLRGEVLEQQLDYWKRQLAGIPAALELATDRPRAAVHSFRGASIGAILPLGLLQRLNALSHSEGATLFMTLLAAFQALLSRYTGQEDIPVGSPIAGRTQVETEGLIGFFVNTLVLRGDLSGDPTFRQLLARVRETSLEAYAHQDLPFEKLVEELQPERDLGRNPLFQVMFALQNTPASSPELTGLKVAPLSVESKTSHFDLEVYLLEKPSGLTCTFVYATDLFDSGTIVRMMGHYQRLLESVVADPDRCLSTVDLMSGSERHQILVEWNQTETEYPRNKTVHGLFEEQVERTPEAVVLRDGREELRFGELNRRANRLAHFLRKRGVGPEVVVGVCMERSARTVVALLGVLKAGGAYVPLDPSYPEERLAFMLRDSGARVLLTDEPSAPRFSGHEAEVVRLDSVDAALSAESETNPVGASRPGDLAYVIYTSGSTGPPKGVEALHRGCVNRFAWMWRTYPFAAGEVCCQKTALSFVDSVWEIFGPLLQGIPSVVLPEETVRDPRAFLETLAAARVTRIVLVPSLLRALLDSGIDLAGTLPSLRWWVTSGEALSLELYRRFRGSLPGATLINLYGSSEVSADVTCWDSRSAEPRDAVPIGRPIANTQVYILDGRGQPVPVGIPGEIYVGGHGLARGYRNRPELTAERFLPDPFRRVPGARLFRTGDRGRYRDDGQIEYLVRTDFQIKLRGRRIEPGEIESRLGEHAAVVQAVVCLREDLPDQPRLVA